MGKVFSLWRWRGLHSMCRYTREVNQFISLLVHSFTSSLRLRLISHSKNTVFSQEMLKVNATMSPLPLRQGSIYFLLLLLLLFFHEPITTLNITIVNEKLQTAWFLQDLVIQISNYKTTKFGLILGVKTCETHGWRNTKENIGAKKHQTTT